MADSTQATNKKSTSARPAKKSTAKKTAVKKSTTKKSTSAEREPAKRTAVARAASSQRGTSGTETRESGNDSRGDRKLTRPARFAREARQVVLELTGKMPESVTGLERTDEGWQVDVEVLELERIPSTTDVLATYRVDLGDDGEVAGYRRVRRYLRGSPRDEEG
jgi:hypothetical protein